MYLNFRNYPKDILTPAGAVAESMKDMEPLINLDNWVSPIVLCTYLAFFYHLSVIHDVRTNG